jgi:arylsulfatase
MTNVALVVLDTLRKDAFDRHFDWLPGRRFERAYTTANWTVPAHASLFTGRYASEVGVHSKHLYCDCPEPTLAERLREAGYTTRAFSANTNITGYFEFDRGFADFRTAEAWGENEDLFDWRGFTKTTDVTGFRKYLDGAYECVVGDTKTIRSLVAGLKLKLGGNVGAMYGGTREAIAELEHIDFGDGEFLFLNLMEAHEPYRAPEAYMSGDEPPLTNSVGDISLGTVDGERVRSAYDDCVSYLSDVYRELFARLTEEFDYVITLSDHGEMLGESDAWAHEHGAYPELAHVPLVVSGDGLAGICVDPVNLLDVHRTTLELAGIDGDSRGRNLLDDSSDGRRECVVEYHGLTPWSERKLEASYGDLVERYDEELFGYGAPIDYYGYETTSGFEARGMTDVADPRGRLNELVATRDVRQVRRDNEVPDEIEDQLRHLGYA